MSLEYDLYPFFILALKIINYSTCPMKKACPLLTMFLLAIFFSWPACIQQGGEDYLPCADGMKWEYATETCIEGTCKEGTVITRYAGEEKINGKKYLKRYASKDGSSEQLVSYDRKANEGLFGITAQYKDKPEQLVMPLLYKAGQTYTYTSYVPVRTTTEATMAGKETLSLHGTTYANCYKFSYKTIYEEGDWKGAQSEGISYVAPNIGLVKTFMHVPNKVTFTITLTRYEP
jgi:hypothetical protein